MVEGGKAGGKGILTWMVSNQNEGSQAAMAAMASVRTEKKPAQATLGIGGGQARGLAPCPRIDASDDGPWTGASSE